MTLNYKKQYRIRIIKDIVFNNAGLVKKNTSLVISHENTSGWTAVYGNHALSFKEDSSLFSVVEEVKPPFQEFMQMIQEDKEDAETFLYNFSLKELRDTCAGLSASAKSLRSLIYTEDKFSLYSLANTLANSFRKEFGYYLPDFAKFSDTDLPDTSRTRCVSLSANILAIFDISAHILSKKTFGTHEIEILSYILSLSDASQDEDPVVKSDTDSLLTFLSIHENKIFSYETDDTLIFGNTIRSPKGPVIAYDDSISLNNDDPSSQKLIKDTAVFRFPGNTAVLVKKSGEIAVADMNSKTYLKKSAIDKNLAEHIYLKCA